MSTEQLCWAWAFQDDSSSRCIRPLNHEGDHKYPESPFVITVSPAYRTMEHRVEDPHFRAVTRGDGITYTVPVWIAEALEQKQEPSEITIGPCRIDGEVVIKGYRLSVVGVGQITGRVTGVNRATN